MSIKYLSYAFDSRVKNPLRKLVLLKLCDNANDDGECWPSFQHIADQCEVSRRSAINHIKSLVDEGFLSVHPRFKDGEQTTNMYRINKNALLGSAGYAPPSESPAPPPVQELHPPSAGAAPRTVIEPSVLTNTSESLTHDLFSTNASCPHKAIIDIYHRCLPQLQRVVETNWRGSSREKDLQARWRHDKRHQSLDFWEAYFEGVSRSKFHLGENDRQWKADLGWLIKRANFDKMVEKIQGGLI